MHGRKAGTHGWGARKKHKKSGHRGGKGMAGTGKRADQKKSLMTKLYGNRYFGKQGVTSRGTKKDKDNRINLGNIEENTDMYLKKGIAKKVGNKIEIDLSSYKILGEGELKRKIVIKAQSASKSAIEKIEKSGGEIFLSRKSAKKEKENPSTKKSEGKIALTKKRADDEKGKAVKVSKENVK